MSSTLLDRWAWILVVATTLIVVLPLAVIWLILQLPEMLRLAATIVIFIVWGVVSGYKDWLISKRRESEQETSGT